MKKLKPYGLYASTDHEGVWKRVSSYKTMASALQALYSVTAKPRSERKRLYTVLPNDTTDVNKKFLAIHPDYTEQIKKTAR